MCRTPVSKVSSNSEGDEGKSSKGDYRKRLPSALIIGASKCGTGTLLTFLNLHPDIRIPDLSKRPGVPGEVDITGGQTDNGCSGC